MTCIVAIKQDGKVWMGADSLSADGQSVVMRADPKLFVNSGFLIGYTTSYRMGQLLQYKLTPPKRHADVDLHRYMATEFIDAVRQCLKDGGVAEKHDEAESGGKFLVGHRGEIFVIDEDYQVGIPADAFASVGSGESAALGSLYSTEGFEPRPRPRIELALRAAERHTSTVRGPFVFETLAGAT